MSPCASACSSDNYLRLEAGWPAVLAGTAQDMLNGAIWVEQHHDVEGLAMKPPDRLRERCQCDNYAKAEWVFLNLHGPH